MDSNDRLPSRPGPKLDRVVGPVAAIVAVHSLPLLYVLISARNRLIRR
jgi:hypothetical protein